MAITKNQRISLMVRMEAAGESMGSFEGFSHMNLIVLIIEHLMHFSSCSGFFQ